MKNKTLVTLGIVGGLVALGGLAYTYIRKPKKNKDGFYNASGTSKMNSNPDWCYLAMTPEGDTYINGTTSPKLRLGGTCLQTVGQHNAVPRRV